jgi:nitroreductase
METWNAITSRRNVRSFTDRPLAEDDLDRILEAGRLAPSGRNWQPWDFVAVTDRELLDQLSSVGPGTRPVAQSAATVAVVLPDSDDPGQNVRARFDTGQAVMAMMIAAADLGIGSCHSSVGDQDLARRILGFPADKRCAYLISLGYPAHRPLAPIKSPDRRPFEDVVHREHW